MADDRVQTNTDSQESYEAVTADPRWADAISLTEQNASDLNDQLIVACGMVPGDHLAPFISLRLLEQREDFRREVERLRARNHDHVMAAVKATETMAVQTREIDRLRAEAEDCPLEHRLDDE